MAGNFNRVILLGNLTRDVELRHTSGNNAVANIGVAVNRRWRSAEGEDREEVTFIDCEAWGKTAEIMSKYLAKGRPVFIEGRLKLDQWEDKEGKKQSKLRVVVESFQFVDSRAGGGSGGGGGGGGGGGDEARPRGQARGAGVAGGAGGEAAPSEGGQAKSGNWGQGAMEDEDIPF